MTNLASGSLPHLRPDLVIGPEADDGSRVLHDPANGRYFRLGRLEARLLERMDGGADLEALFRDALAACPGGRVSKERVVGFADRAARLGWFEGRAPEAARPRRSWTRIAIRFGSAERLLSRLDPLIRRLYRPPVLVAAAALVIAAALWGSLHAGGRGISLPAGASGWLLTWLAFVLVSAPHELGHALTLRYFGGRSRTFGFMLLYGIPCFYCDLSGAWLLPERRARILTGLAGLGWQFAFGGLALAALPLLDPASPSGQLLRAAVGLCGVTALLNLNPLIRMDGYWILSDWLGVPNLRRRSFAYLAAWARRLFGSWGHSPSHRSEPPRATARERWIYVAYGVSALGYTAALCAGVAWAAGRAMLPGW